MDIKPEWEDEILKEIMKGKANEELENTGEESPEITESEWDSINAPPVLRHLAKSIHADKYCIHLLCQWHIKDQIEQLMLDWNYENKPYLDIIRIKQIVNIYWQRYKGLYPPPESYILSILFKSKVSDWADIAWDKFLEFLGDETPLKVKFIKEMEKHISSVDDGKRLRDFLSGYFLIANHEAPGYIINDLFKSMNDIADSPPTIDKEKYDSEGYALYQAIIIDGFAQSLCEDPLKFIDIFKVQDTEFIRDIRSLLTILIGLMEVENGKE